MRAAKAQRGVTWVELNAQCGVAQREFYPAHTASKRGFTRQTIGRLAEYFADPELERYAESDVYWDEVESIDYRVSSRRMTWKCRARTTLSPMTSWCITATPLTTA